MFKEGSKADRAQDKKGAKKMGVSMKKFEGSPMDMAQDAQMSSGPSPGFAKGGAVTRGDGMATKGKTKGKCV